MRLFSLCALLAAAVLAGASAAPASHKRPTDRQLAARAVLKPADFPRGWTAVNQPQAISCPALTAARDAASGSARSKAFKHGDNTEAQSAVYVFRDVAAAKRRLKSMSGAGTLRCYTERLTDLLSRTSGVEVGKVERAALDIEPAGDQRAAARVKWRTPSRASTWNCSSTSCSSAPAAASRSERSSTCCARSTKRCAPT